MKRFLLVALLLSGLQAAPFLFSNDKSNNLIFEAQANAPRDGYYSKTSQSVTIYHESGHCVGTFSVYLHKGKKYIDFRNNWVCIQGKQRFAFQGNSYIIK